jgi:hypothetical protein
MLLHTRNNKTSGLGVETSTVFEIFGHFLYQGVQDNSVWLWPTYPKMLFDTRNKNIWFRGGDLSDFETIGHFLFEGGRDYHVRSWFTWTYHGIRCYLTQETRICIALGWQSQQFSKKMGTSSLRGNGITPDDHDLHTIWWSLTQGTRI